MKAKILVVDDEPEVADSIAQILEEEGYGVITAGDDLWALYYYDEFQPDLIMLDIRFGFDEMMGLDILKKIREKDKTIPIIMLSGLDRDGIVKGSYDSDADHFVRKSSRNEELLALVKRCMRRSKPESLVIDDRIEIDRGGKSIKINTDGEWEPVYFERKEFELLEKLVLHPGQVVTREALYDQFFPKAENPASALDRYISELRKKLEPDCRNPQYILTKRGVGYWFKYYK